MSVRQPRVLQLWLVFVEHTLPSWQQGSWTGGKESWLHESTPHQDATRCVLSVGPRENWPVAAQPTHTPTIQVTQPAELKGRAASRSAPRHDRMAWCNAMSTEARRRSRKWSLSRHTKFTADTCCVLLWCCSPHSSKRLELKRRQSVAGGGRRRQGKRSGVVSAPLACLQGSEWGGFPLSLGATPPLIPTLYHT